jgi:hypothetical protein
MGLSKLHVTFAMVQDLPKIEETKIMCPRLKLLPCSPLMHHLSISFEVVFVYWQLFFFDEFFSTCIVVLLVEHTAFASSSITSGNLVGVGLQLFPTLFVVFSTCKRLLVGIMLCIVIGVVLTSF